LLSTNLILGAPVTSNILIEPSGSKDLGICPCCGRRSKRVWGQAYFGDRASAAYFVEWTVGHIPDLGANIDMIIGNWGEGTTPDERNAVALAYRLLDSGPSMMVIDANARAFSSSALVGQALNRDDVIDSLIASDAFAIADAILEQDGRVAELRGDRIN
jgi:hypothetical protein